MSPFIVWNQLLSEENIVSYQQDISKNYFFHRIHSFHIKPIKSPTGNYHFFAKILIIINLISVKSSNIYKEEFKSILFNKCVKHYIIQLFISLSVSLFIGSFLYCNGDFPNDFLKHLLK